MSLDNDADTLAVVCALGNATANGARTKVGEGIAGKVAQQREPLLIQGQVSVGRSGNQQRGVRAADPPRRAVRRAQPERVHGTGLYGV